MRDNLKTCKIEITTEYTELFVHNESGLMNAHNIKNNNECRISVWMIWKSTGRSHCNPYQSKKIQT